MNKKIRRRSYMRAWRKAHPILAKRRVLKAFDRHPTRHAHLRHVSEIRNAIRVLNKREEPPRGTCLEDLYKILVRVIKSDIARARAKFPFGKPDAAGLNTEFKIGFDRVHGNQLIWNIINNQRGKIRWFKSYEDLERMLRDGKNRSRVFQSYKDFILWRYGVN